MKVTENSKFTLTIGQLRRVIQEANEEGLDSQRLEQEPEQSENDEASGLPIDDLGEVLRLNDCPKQRKLCWDYPGFVLVHKKVNPTFDDSKPMLCVVDQTHAKDDEGNEENLGWNYHYHNFVQGATDAKTLDDLYNALTASCDSGTEFKSAAFSPGGISGYNKLSQYGFKKVWLPNDTLSYWSSKKEWGGDVDVDKLEGWLNGGKHLDEFLVKGRGDTWLNPKDCPNMKFTYDNTKPRPFKMVKVGGKVSENTKFTLTIGQLRRLVKEATALNEAPDQEPLDRMEGDILRLGPCNHQKALCWNLQGFCFTPAKVNPSFSKRMPYMMVCKQDDTWQLHFENFGNFDSKSYLDALYKAFAKTCEEQGIKEINAVGGCTPGGISGISALERYGFHKEYLPTPRTLKVGADGDKTNIYWGGDTIDPAKVEKWLNGGKHLQDFLVVGNPEKRHEHPEECPLSEPTGEERYTLDNTNPRPFMMVR